MTTLTRFFSHIFLWLTNKSHPYIIRGIWNEWWEIRNEKGYSLNKWFFFCRLFIYRAGHFSEWPFQSLAPRTQQRKKTSTKCHIENYLIIRISKYIPNRLKECNRKKGESVRFLFLSNIKYIDWFVDHDKSASHFPKEYT